MAVGYLCPKCKSSKVDMENDSLSCRECGFAMKIKDRRGDDDMKKIDVIRKMVAQGKSLGEVMGYFNEKYDLTKRQRRYIRETYQKVLKETHQAEKNATFPQEQGGVLVEKWDASAPKFEVLKERFEETVEVPRGEFPEKVKEAAEELARDFKRIYINLAILKNVINDLIEIMSKYVVKGEIT